MRVQQLIRLLERFEPDATVRLCASLPNRVIDVFEHIWVADYGGGPQINVALQIRPFTIYVGLGLEQTLRDVPRPTDLGTYHTPEDTAKVRDFYVLHKGLHEPLHFPEFDYDDWLPPRTVSGEYNPLIAEILREKLLQE